MENKEKGAVDTKELSISKWLENFWYHYKWHTIIALASVIILSLLILQTCSRTSYDGYILYAGNHEIKRTSSDGDLSPYSALSKKLELICSDFNGDGVTNLNLLNLFVLNEQEAEQMLEEKPGQSINDQLVISDTETLSQNMIYGSYYLCFLSERLFLEYEALYGGEIFTDLQGYVPEGSDIIMASEHGIYLSSLDFYSLTDVCDLPDDTVICLRRINEVWGALDKNDAREAFLQGERMLKSLIDYKK